MGSPLARCRPLLRYRGYVFFQDAEFHWAYTYRDYVIRSFNSDLPFDRFLMEQLAADRLADAATEGGRFRRWASSRSAAGS